MKTIIVIEHRRIKPQSELDALQGAYSDYFSKAIPKAAILPSGIQGYLTALYATPTATGSAHFASQAGAELFIKEHMK